MEQAPGPWGKKPDEERADVLRPRTPHRRELVRARGMECAMDTAKALEGAWVEGMARVVAEAGATAAAVLKVGPATREPAQAR